MLTFFNPKHAAAPRTLAHWLGSSRLHLSDPSEAIVVKTAEGNVVVAGRGVSQLSGSVALDASPPCSQASKKIIGVVVATATASFRPSFLWLAYGTTGVGVLATIAAILAGDPSALHFGVLTAAAAASGEVVADADAAHRNVVTRARERLADHGILVSDAHREPPITMAEAMVLAGYP